MVEMKVLGAPAEPLRSSVEPTGPTTPALAFGFKGTDGTPVDGFFHKPPDTHMAVGTGAGAAGRIVEVTNTDIEIFDKTGTSLATAGGLGAFLGLADGVGFDPKVLFDQHSGRFFIVVLEGKSVALSVVHIAVSTTSTPSNTTTDWTKLSGSAVTSIPSCGPCTTWFDYPGIGADSDSLFITGNLFDAGDLFRGVKIRVFDKSAVTGLLAGVYSFVDIDVDDAAEGGGTFTIQPAHVFGATDNGNFYLIDRASSAAYRLWEISGDPGAPTVVQKAAHSWTGGTFLAPGAPQMGTAVTLDTLSSRIQNAVYRAGEIWLVLTADADADSKAEVVWQRIATHGGSPSLPTVTDSGFIDGSDGDEWTFMPSIAANVSGDATICYSQSFTDQFPDMRYVSRSVSDPPTTFQASVVAATSPGFYSAFFEPPADRWGDYSATVIDPDDDETFCIAHEKVLAAAAPGSVIWDTFIGCLGAVQSGCVDDGFEPDDTCFGGFIGLASPESHLHCDEDWVFFEGTAGVTYRIETSNLVGGADTTLALHLGCGPELAFNDDVGAGVASRIDWTAVSSGDYDVRIREFGDSYDSGEGYDVTVTCIANCGGLIFQDGFESGDTSAWSSAIP